MCKQTTDQRRIPHHDDVIKWKISSVTGILRGEFTSEFPAQRPVTRSFDAIFDLINTWVNKIKLREPRNARPHEPAPIIVRFLRRTDRNRVISERKQLKDYNQDRDFKIYVNEDLTTRRAKLFAKMRTLQKKRLLKQAWTYNGNIKVMMPNGEIKNIANISSIQSLLPDVDISTVN